MTRFPMVVKPNSQAPILSIALDKAFTTSLTEASTKSLVTFISMAKAVKFSCITGISPVKKS